MTNYITDNTTLPFPKTDLITLLTGADTSKYMASADWNTLCQALIDVKTFLRGGFQLFDGTGTNHVPVQMVSGNPSGVVTAAKGALAVDYTTPGFYQNKDGATTWSKVGAGGYSGLWASGSVPYSNGMIVRKGPFVFGAEADNSIDPCFDFGNMGDNTVWQGNGANVVQTSATGVVLFNTGAQNGQSNNCIYKSTVAGWDKRRLIVDLEMSGAADGFNFGILDGSLPATTASVSGMAGVTGFWGAGLEIYDPGTPGFYSITNGTQANRVTDSNDDITTASNQRFTRWYLDFVDNGVGAGTCTMTLYRDAYPGVLVGGSNNYRIGFADDLTQLAQWTVTRPTFTNWRFALGSHTGGSSAIFAAKNAFARYTGTEWYTLSRLPTRK